MIFYAAIYLTIALVIAIRRFSQRDLECRSEFGLSMLIGGTHFSPLMTSFSVDANDKPRPATESSELVKGNACTIGLLETAVFAG